MEEQFDDIVIRTNFFWCNNPVGLPPTGRLPKPTIIIWLVTRTLTYEN